MSPNKTFVRFREANLHVGDLLVWSAYHTDGKPVSKLADSIARFGEGWSHHVSVVCWHDGSWSTIEMLPEGGVRKQIYLQVDKFPDIIHHFEVPDSVVISWPDSMSASASYNRDAAVAKAEEFLGTKYGYNQIFEDFIRHSPVGRWIVDMPTDDSETAKSRLVCSGLASIAVSSGFGFDLFPNFADSAVEPSDFTRSPLLRDCGILVP